MSARSETRSVESDAAPGALLAILADGARIPEWAPAFADIVVQDGAEWRATADERSFGFRVVVQPASGTVDYLRELAPGRVGGAYLRVTPRLGGGSVVVMTLPVAPDTEPAAVRATLTAELAALVRLG